METDFKDNIINPLPQRMVHHTNHDKENTCLLKGKKEKCTLLFFVCLKKFDQVARRCLAWLCTSLVGLPGSEGGWAAHGPSRRWPGSWALLLKAIARFQSNGNVLGLNGTPDV